MSDNKSEEKIKFLRNLVNSAKEKLSNLEAESRNLAEQNKQLLLQNIFLLEKLEEQERILAVLEETVLKAEGTNKKLTQFLYSKYKELHNLRKGSNARKNKKVR